MEAEKIIVLCDKCSAQFRISSKFADKTIKCPKCAAAIRVPAGGQPVAPVGVAPAGYGSQEAMDSPHVTFLNIPRSAIAQAQAQHAATAAVVAPPAAPVATQAKTRQIQRPNVAVADPYGAPAGYQAASAQASRQRGKTNRRGAMPTNKSGLPGGALVGIVAGVAVILVIVLAITFTGSSNPNDNGVAGQGGNGSTENGGAEPVGMDLQKQIKASFDEQWTATADLSGQRAVLEQYQRRYADSPLIQEDYRQRVRLYLKRSEDEIESSDTITDQSKAEKLAKLGGWVETLGRDIKSEDVQQYGRDAFEKALEYDPENATARVAAGHKQFQLRNGKRWPDVENAKGSDLRDWAELHFLIPKELEDAEGQWFSPTEHKRLLELETSTIDHTVKVWNGDWWEINFSKQKFFFAQDEYLKGFEWEPIDARPFVVLLEKGSSSKMLERINKLKDSCQQYWDWWTKTWVTPLGLKSRDTIEIRNERIDEALPSHIYPFKFLSFKEEETYTEYLAKKDQVLPPGARAFYDRSIETVVFYEESAAAGAGDNEFELSVIIHEATHQLLDRFGPEGLEPMRSHWVGEGYPDYTSGYTLNNGKFTFAQPNNARIRSIAMLREQINVNPDDFAVFDIPTMLTLPDIRFVIWWTSRIPTVLFNKDRRYAGWLLQQQMDPTRNQAIFHSMFYAFAWAFVYWLNEVSDYHDEFCDHLVAELNGRGGAAGFCENFDIDLDRPLPELEHHMDRLHQPASQQAAMEAVLERIDILRNDNKIKRMNEDWLEWLRSITN